MVASALFPAPDFHSSYGPCAGETRTRRAGLDAELALRGGGNRSLSHKGQDELAESGVMLRQACETGGNRGSGVGLKGQDLFPPFTRKPRMGNVAESRRVSVKWTAQSLSTWKLPSRMVSITPLPPTLRAISPGFIGVVLPDTE